MSLEFRDLRADEIECRVSTCSSKGVSILLYKDARCDMNILDETVGCENWQRRHTRENANCIVSIWDSDKKMWIEKEDTGKESYTEKEKGLASDSFKRACFNWGIGRELYTAPFIWIGAKDVDVRENPKKQGSYMTYDQFRVGNIEIRDKKITGLSIVKERTGEVVYHYGGNGGTGSGPEPNRGESKSGAKRRASPENSGMDEMTGGMEEPRIASMRRYIEQNGLKEDVICSLYKVGTLSELSEGQCSSIMDEKYLPYWKQKCGVA